ncbi:MAG: amidinotransferase [Bacteroidetes bacterium HGW-Bacteroidetes-13]|nr:MAG: amidinotransferase [Bacteroidetes bacterium HGW-Bacteroidetes-13]
MSQITDTLLMVRPANFRMNEQTAVNNFFQSKTPASPEQVNALAQNEFDNFVKKLRSVGVHVIVVDDTASPDTPDALFPNNWISFHANGNVALYPMFAENRRLERRDDILERVESEGFIIENIIDYTTAEEEQIYLEGTGSLVLDRAHQKAYCALSPRADEDLIIEFCEDFEYTPVIFTAYQTVNDQRLQIYHTNVMMALAETFAVICLESIDDKSERKNVVKHLKENGKEIIDISEEQMEKFAGNMLQVKSKNGIPFMVMSEVAFQCLSQTQVNAIRKHCEILYSSLSTIEKCGGGSARCMMAEVFLPKKQ